MRRYEDQSEVRLYNYTDVYKNEFITNDFELMVATASSNEIEKFTVNPDDVIITKDSESSEDIAQPALIAEELNSCVSGYHLALIRTDKIIGEFLFRAFQTKRINDYYAIRVTGVKRAGLSYGDISNVFIPYPSVNKQKQIVQHIKNETTKIDHAIAKAGQEISLIKEAMIAEAVLGKLEIAKKLDFEEDKKWAFKEAVLISILTEEFSSSDFPLGRKRYTKLSYLFHQMNNDSLSLYKHKAACPYNPKTKYQGPEKIAIQNKYIESAKRGKYSGFVIGEFMGKAKEYFDKYWSWDLVQELKSKYKYKKNVELELINTVHKAGVHLIEKGENASLDNVRQHIYNQPEWKAKLDRAIFSDENDLRTLSELQIES